MPILSNQSIYHLLCIFNDQHQEKFLILLIFTLMTSSRVQSTFDLHLSVILDSGIVSCFVSAFLNRAVNLCVSNFLRSIFFISLQQLYPGLKKMS